MLLGEYRRVWVVESIGLIETSETKTRTCTEIRYKEVDSGEMDTSQYCVGDLARRNGARGYSVT